MKKLEKTDQEWSQTLTPEEFKVCRKKGTERAFSGQYHDCKKSGVYVCKCCKMPLFDSEAKFDSGTGWPSFWQPTNENNITEESDNSLFMRRTEVLCSACDAHLGHVFQDGPNPTGLRYCINSVSLDLIENDVSE
jgi:peptide-methionine (R)-S-oxide reductase